MKNSNKMLLPMAVVALIVVFGGMYVPSSKKENYGCPSCMMK